MSPDIFAVCFAIRSKISPYSVLIVGAFGALQHPPTGTLSYRIHTNSQFAIKSCVCVYVSLPFVLSSPDNLAPRTSGLLTDLGIGPATNHPRHAGPSIRPSSAHGVAPSGFASQQPQGPYWRGLAGPGTSHAEDKRINSTIDVSW